jgi:hypothetical protein
LDYLVGEKFINFLEIAETHPELRAEIPAFVAEIKAIFETWQLAEYLETARQTEPFDAGLYDGEAPETVEDGRQEDIRRCATDLLLVERAREWLLGEGESCRGVAAMMNFVGSGGERRWTRRVGGSARSHRRCWSGSSLTGG